MKSFLKYYITFGLFLLSTAILLAQKLPSTQDSSLKAPAKVAIDGKITEWGNRFQAYNYANDIYYSIANDNDKLYVVIQARNIQAVKKIIGGNITLAIMPDAKIPDSQAASITFPVLKIAVKSNLGIKYNNRLNIDSKDAAVHSRKTDSLLASINEDLGSVCKEIKLAGMKGVADSMISVYNADGFKAAMAFDKEFSLNYELAIPLTSLGISIESSAFTYKLSVNGINFSDATHYHTLPSGETVTVTTSPRSITTGGTTNMDAMNSTTYLKGMYTLAK